MIKGFTLFDCASLSEYAHYFHGIELGNTALMIAGENLPALSKLCVKINNVGSTSQLSQSSCSQSSGSKNVS